MKRLLLLLAFVSPGAFAQTGLLEMPPSTQFEVNAKSVMEPRAGVNGRRTKVGQEGGTSSPSFIGAFRISCPSSHQGFFDPIVYPNVNGRSHLHTFFGNSGIAHDTNTATLPDVSLPSTCKGGTINRSGYWVPSMIDTITGFVVNATQNVVYYKSTEGGPYDGTQEKLNLITTPPAGLRMIAGNPSGSAPGWQGRWDCMSYALGYAISSTAHIPATCDAGTHYLLMSVRFPNCWDGVNLDSPMHGANGDSPHMAYATSGAPCPETHPVPIPVISFNVHYQIPYNGATANWRLSSDLYATSSPGGYSGHGDWINGWEQEYLETIVNNCIRKARDCHDGSLGRSPDTLPATALGYEMY
jgi:hypothetical protein